MHDGAFIGFTRLPGAACLAPGVGRFEHGRCTHARSHSSHIDVHVHAYIGDKRSRGPRAVIAYSVACRETSRGCCNSLAPRLRVRRGEREKGAAVGGGEGMRVASVGGGERR